MNTPPNTGTVLLLADLALLLAVVTAIGVSGRRARHWPVALYILALVLCDWVRRGLALGLLSAPGPYTGLARGAFHLEEALFLVGPMGLAVLAAVVLARRAPWAELLTYVALVVALVVGYPTLRAELLVRTYLAIEVAALAAVVVGTVQWVRRRERVELTTVVILFCAAADLVKVFAGPFRGDLSSTWWLAWPVHAVLWLVVAALQGGAWWQLRRR